MAELYDLIDELPPEKVLRLSIKWLSTRDVYPDGPYGEFLIGMFLGDKPLFADHVYVPLPDPFGRPIPLGYFHGQDSECALLRGIAGVLQTGERLDYESEPLPEIRLVFGSDYLHPKFVDPQAPYFDVLVVIQWGGTWHGKSMGDSGPGMKISVTREELQKFHADLLAEALDPAICDEVSQGILRERHLPPHP